MKLYNIGNLLHRYKVPLLPKIINVLIRFIHNSAVFSETAIGKNTIFAYGGIGVVIHKRSVIGKNCIIGDNCFIATGAKILGDIKVGNNCVIVANCVVVTDIPDNCVVAGIPGKVIKTDINPKDYY